MILAKWLQEDINIFVCQFPLSLTNILQVLADPGKARGCSKNTIGIHSLI